MRRRWRCRLGALILLALLMTACGRRATQISGVVTSGETGLPLSGVAVRFGSSQTKTDSSGEYALSTDRPGIQRLYAWLSGYEPYSRDITATLSASTVCDFTLPLQPLATGVGPAMPEESPSSRPEDESLVAKVPSEDTEPPSVRFEKTPSAVASSSVSFAWRGTDNTSSAAALEYAYRLTPNEVSWTDWAHVESVSYNRLLPSSYHFEVKARDEAGNASSPVAASFSVAPATTTPPAAASGSVDTTAELTRSSAVRLIAADPVEGKTWVGFFVDPHAAEAQIRAAFDTLKADGYINDYSLSYGFWGRMVDITSTTAKGAAYLIDLFGEEVSESYHGLYRDPFDHLVWCDNLLVAAWSKASIEVTDIQRMGTWALVKYAWKRGEATPVLRILQSVLSAEVLQQFPAGQTQEGTACFSLHDDGWRVGSCL